MHLMSRGRATHSDRLERWLGAEKVADLSRQMRDFYWPIPVHGVPGKVFAMPGGDFAGEIDAGQFGSALDRGSDALTRMRNERRANLALHKISHSQTLRGKMDRRQHAFGSLSALIAAATGGKAQNITFQKTGVAANAIGNSNDLWTRAGTPSAGAAAAAAPSGTVPTSATAGALPYRNASVADGNHFTTGYVSASVIANTLLLYDRIFAVAKTMNSTAAQAVTGTPTRYQSSVATDAAYAGGNFMFPSNPTTVLAATAHNWTPIGYTNQAGTTLRSSPSIAGVSACVVGGVDLAVGNWFIPLQAGDVGVRALTNMQCSAAVATGTIDFVMGHPIALFPCPVANMACIVDGVNTAFNLTTILDGACLAFLELTKPATTATNYSGIITIVSE